jgi:hypothetical protein
VVLTPREVRALLHEISGTMWLIVSLLYGPGMLEAVSPDAPQGGYRSA